MGFMKRWFEDHVPDFSDAELMEMGYSKNEIDWLRECFPKKEERNEQEIS